jgi:phospholipid:diacylglycerol acyltransferase
MLSLVTFNRDKWISAMMLDPVTGLDPLGAKVRAAEGIDAASSFIQGYWIWCAPFLRMPRFTISHIFF